MSISYSIVIRTLGNTGEKYRMMLDSIRRQTVAPEEVIVVIPYGYDLDYELGDERIVRCEKGMVTQRVVGIDECQSENMLVLDDDILLPDDFVEKMHGYMVCRSLDCVLAYGGGGSVSEPKHIPIRQKLKPFIKRLRGAYTGQYYYSNRKSEYFDVIMPTGGHKTYVKCEEGLCQAGCFQCFYMRSEKAKAVNFGDERWLEQGSISKYAAYDDAVFFYKAYLNGCRIAYTSTTNYCHLDAGAGRVAKSRLESKRIRLYSIARNRTIFWRKHLWGRSHTLKMFIGGLYGMTNYFLYNVVANSLPKYWPAIGAMCIGYKEAFHWNGDR